MELPPVIAGTKSAKVISKLFRTIRANTNLLQTTSLTFAVLFRAFFSRVPPCSAYTYKGFFSGGYFTSRTCTFYVRDYILNIQV